MASTKGLPGASEPDFSQSCYLREAVVHSLESLEEVQFIAFEKLKFILLNEQAFSPED